MTDRVDATCVDCEDDKIKPMVEGVYELKKVAVKEYRYGKGLVLTFLNSESSTSNISLGPDINWDAIFRMEHIHPFLDIIQENHLSQTKFSGRFKFI